MLTVFGWKILYVTFVCPFFGHRFLKTLCLTFCFQHFVYAGGGGGVNAFGFYDLFVDSLSCGSTLWLP